MTNLVISVLLWTNTVVASNAEVVRFSWGAVAGKQATEVVKTDHVFSQLEIRSLTKVWLSPERRRVGVTRTARIGDDWVDISSEELDGGIEAERSRN